MPSATIPGECGAGGIPAGSSAMAEATGTWKVYLVECVDGTYYCGVAKHLERRLAEHNGLRTGGARYTRSRRPVKLLGFTECPDKASAYRLEYAIKAAPREKKLEILQANQLSTYL
ncbi:MAG: hypothetical protein DESF_01356 [Desulfovibrio sp.]